MALVRIALLQTDSSATPFDRNKLHVLDDLLGHLATDQAHIVVCLPELWLTGYFNFDKYLACAEPMDGYTVGFLKRLASEHKVYLIPGSILIKDKNRGILNTALAIAPNGKLLARYEKIHLFGFESQEPSLVTPGNQEGFFDTPFGRIGLAICYDLRFPELFRKLVLHGCRIFLVPAAWPKSRINHMEILAVARAIENQAIVAVCNTVGINKGVELGGSSLIVGPDGATLAKASSKEQIVYTDIDTSLIDMYRVSFPVLKDIKLL
jgi:predicted amidohydrolase